MRLRFVFALFLSLAATLAGAQSFSVYLVGRGAAQATGSLESFVGYVPSHFNMMPWNGPFSGASDFTNVQYTTTRAAIAANVTGPTNAPDAQKLVENSGSGTHFVQSPNTPGTNTTTPIPYRVAVIAKAVERTRIVIFWQGFEEVTAVSIGFDLAGGNVGYDNSVGANFTLLGTAMTDLGNGWWLCTFDFSYNVLTAGGAGRSWSPQINLDNGSGTAARSISYAGNGTAGVNLWWFNVLPKAAWDMTTLSFQDDFSSLSTIDLSNTKAPGFKWYVNNLFTNSFMPTFGWSTNPPSAPSLASNFSIPSPSILRIYNPNKSTTGYTSQIWSVVDDGAGGYRGFAAKPPLVFDGYFSWDGVQATYNPNWAGNPAFWGVPVEVLVNNPPLDSASHFNEWDVVEGAPNNDATRSGSTAKHDFSNPTTPVNLSLGQSLLTVMRLGTFKRMSGIWLTPASTGTGWGLFQTYINGQFKSISDVAYSASAGSQPGNHMAALSGSDNQHITVFLNTAENVGNDGGGGWAMDIDWVKVYTNPAFPYLLNRDLNPVANDNTPAFLDKVA